MTNEKIPLTIDAWKAKLLDLTKRNRALNFKPNKVSTVTIIDEQPPEIYKILCLTGRSMKFKAAAQPDSPPAPIHGGSSDDDTADDRRPIPGDEEVEEDVEAPDFVPYEAATLGDQQTDDCLQTNSAPEKLDKSLRRIEEQARLSQEEQGVNTLFLALGMLQYNESSDSKVPFKAPLILVPVELERRSARSGYTIRKSDDDTIVNPSLAEYLKRNFGLTLPELPDAESVNETYDLQSFFGEVVDAIAGQPAWAVKNEIHLSLFSFQKLVMYKDLEKNVENLSDHPIIRKVITRTGDSPIGLPEDVRGMVLDRDFAPETTSQVVDADSSQLRAIAAVAKNHNLVLEGPPGTGKSQTITNLIAQSLSAGKTVLFVAEKKAALEVVHRRLVAAGMGEFCLELHSTKANKRAVMNEIRASLDASLQRLAVSQASTSRLPGVRNELTDYVEEVHTPYGTLNQSPYSAFGELGSVLGADKIVLQCDIFSYRQSQIDEALRDVTLLAEAAGQIGVPSAHPWRSTTKTFYSEFDLDRIAENLSSIKEKLAEVTEDATAVEQAFGLPPIAKLTDVETAICIASVMSRSPGAPASVLANEAWNTPPADAKDLIAKGRRVTEMSERIEKCFTPAVLESDPSEEIDYVEQKHSGYFAFLAFLDGRYRAIKKRWLGLRLPSYEGRLIEQIGEMKTVAAYLNEKSVLEQKGSAAESLFGSLWKGEHSNWAALDDYVVWVLEFRRLCVEHGLKEQAVATANAPAPDVTAVQTLAQKIEVIKRLLSSLIDLVGFAENYFENWSITDIRSRVNELSDNLALAPRWAAFEEIRQKVVGGVIGELLPLAMNGEVSFSELGTIFKRAFYQKWLSQVVTERPALRSFHTISHEQRIKEFRELDQRVLRENRAMLVSLLRERLQNRLREADVQEAMTFLRRELARQRGLSPLRITMKRSLPAIRAIKPCLLMGPQTVAQLLEDPAAKFDLVIFDEASQLPTEEAAGAILRGEQLVVVGDPKQLPPTNFFAVQSGQVNAPLDEDGVPLIEDSQSILEEVMGAGVPYSRLKWHYRSAHESLITFSNIHFYDADLYTFPSVEDGSLDSGLHFEFVENGVYEGSGLNRIEARRVADAVVEHIKLKPDLSLGVGTFNMRQQVAIQDELEIRRRQDPSIESFFDKSKEEPFFVKNLENIQGDERDVIFLSVTYAKAPDGRMRYNLGPLNGENGWRRLNVLTTRARRLMRVFSSVRGDEINPAAAASRGPQLLKDFLTYAEHKRLDSPVLAAASDTESPFEKQVLDALTRAGLTVKPQVGVCGYRIDLGVLDAESPGRFVCGIECDGLAYHESQTARDRDRLRQEVLEGRGWDIHRVWSTDWFKDRTGQIERLLSLVEESRQKARTEFQAERERQQLKTATAQEHLRDFLGEQTDANGGADNSQMSEYVRPVAVPYTFASGLPTYTNHQLIEAPTSTIAHAIVWVVEIEAPIHIKDLTTRVAALWGQRSGSSIAARIREISRILHENDRIGLRGDFVWKSNGGLIVRSRKEANIPAERIAPEEIQEAILQILRSGHGFSRQDLVNEARGVFGFARTGPSLLHAINLCVDDLLAQGKVGEGSLGVALRT
jgi:very-short-patch-repair endonuclease